jgi:hypothetical protein
VRSLSAKQRENYSTVSISQETGVRIPNGTCRSGVAPYKILPGAYDAVKEVVRARLKLFSAH